MIEFKEVKINFSFWILSFILLSGPFCYGFFFQNDLGFVMLMSAVIFLLWAIEKGIHTQDLSRISIVQLSAFGFAVAYFIPILTKNAVNPYTAWDYFFRHLSSAFLFIVSYDLSTDKIQMKRLLNILCFAGACATALVLDSAFGGNLFSFLNLNGVGIVDGRVMGPFQYPNTTGAFLCASVLLYMDRALSQKSIKIKNLFSSLLVPMFLAIQLTVSRGAIITFLIVLFLVFLFGKKNRQELFLLIAAPGLLSSFFAMPLFYSISKDGMKHLNGLLLIIFSMYLSFFISSVFRQCFSKLKVKNVMIIMILSVAILIMLYGSLFYFGMAPETLKSHVINKNSFSMLFSGRIDIYKDALYVLQNSGLWGFGGGSWNSLYRRFQTVNYSSSEVHSFFFQIWLDCGIVGLVLIIVFFWFLFSRFIKSDKAVKHCFLLYSCAFYLLLHSLVDFDFSYTYLLIFFYVVMGIAEAQNEISIEKKTILPILPILGAVFLLLHSTNSILANFLAVDANRMINSGVSEEKLIQAIDKMAEAAKRDSKNVSYRIVERKPMPELNYSLVDMCELAEGYMENSSSEFYSLKNEILQIHLNAVEEALSLDAFNPVILSKAGEYFINVEADWDRGLYYLDEALKNNPSSPLRYELNIDYYWKAYLDYEKKQNSPKTNKMLWYILELKELSDYYHVPLNEHTIEIIEKANQKLYAE